MAMRINTEGQFEEVNPVNSGTIWNIISHHVQALRAFHLKVCSIRKIADDEKGKCDIFCILAPKGQLFGIEVKIGSDRRSEHQKSWQERAKKCGAIIMEECKN